MPFADHHDMVKAFPSNRSNHALGIGVLPGRAWCNDLSLAKTLSGSQVIDLSALIPALSQLDDHSPAPPVPSLALLPRRPPSARPRELGLAPAARRLQANDDPAPTSPN